MRYYLLLLAAIGMAGIFFATGIAVAHHTRFLGESAKSDDRNYIFADWALPTSSPGSPDGIASYFVYTATTPVPVRTATSTPLAFGTLVNAGINDWRTAVPQLKWEVADAKWRLPSATYPKSRKDAFGQARRAEDLWGGAMPRLTKIPYLAKVSSIGLA